MLLFSLFSCILRLSFCKESKYLTVLANNIFAIATKTKKTTALHAFITVTLDTDGNEHSGIPEI